MKIFHLSDLHIRDADIEEFRRIAEFIIQKAEEEKPDIALIAGDIFDNQGVKLDSDTAKTAIWFVHGLGLICPLAIVTGTPFHDGKCSEIMGYVLSRHSIWVSTMPEQIYLTKEGDLVKHLSPTIGASLILSMVPTPTKQWWTGEGSIAQTDQDIAAELSGLFAGFGAQADGFECPHVVVGHFSVRGAQISETQIMVGREIEVRKDQLALANADLVCLGHIHEKQIIDPLGPMPIVYSGSVSQLNYGETGEKGFYIHDFVMGDGDCKPEYVRSRFIQTPHRRLWQVKLDMTAEGFDLQGGLDGTDFSNAIARVEIKAFQDEASQIDRQAIEAELKAKGAASVEVRIIRIPRENVRSENLLKIQTLREKVQERARLAGETVAESILDKADELEGLSPEDLARQVSICS